MMFGLPGGLEWLIILVIGLLIFGRRLPEIMRGLGGSVREFRKGIDEGTSEKKDDETAQVDGTQSRDATSEAESTASKPKDDERRL